VKMLVSVVVEALREPRASFDSLRLRSRMYWNRRLVDVRGEGPVSRR